MIATLIAAVHGFARLLVTLLFVRAILSWFAAGNPYSSIGQFYQMLVRFTEPIVKPARMILEKLNINTGMFDFSVLLTFFLIELAETVIVRLLVLAL